MTYHAVEIATYVAFKTLSALDHKPPLCYENEIEQTCINHQQSENLYGIIAEFGRSLSTLFLNTPVTAERIFHDIENRDTTSETFVVLNKKRLDYLAAIEKCRDANKQQLVAPTSILVTRSLENKIPIAQKILDYPRRLNFNDDDYVALYNIAQQVDDIKNPYGKIYIINPRPNGVA